MRFLVPLVVAVVAIFQSPVLRGDFVVDRFNSGSNLMQFGTGTAGNSTNNASILGGTRDASVTVRDQGGNEFFGILGFGAGGLSVAQSNSDEIFGSLTWNSFSAIDFIQGGNDRFRLTSSNSDANFALTNAIRVTVTSGATTRSVVTGVPANAGLPSSTLIDFTQFSGVNFAQVDEVVLEFDLAGYPGNDFGISYFGVTAIPEPGTGCLGALAMGTLMLRRRRRNTA